MNTPQVFKKSIYRLLMQQLQQMKVLIFLLVVSCIVIALCFFRAIPCKWEYQTIDSWINLCEGLSTAYISAFLFYVVTVVLPFVKRQRAVVTVATERLRYIKDEMYETSGTIWGNEGGCDISQIKEPKMLSKVIEPMIQDKDCYDGLTPTNICNRAFLKYHYEKHNKDLLDIFKLYEYLPYNVVNLYSEIINEPVWRIIPIRLVRCKDLLLESDIDDLSKGMIKVHKGVNQLYYMLNKDFGINKNEKG